MRRLPRVAGIFASLVFGGCFADDQTSPDEMDAGDLPPLAAELDVPDYPPTTGTADIEAWLARGYYKNWACEPERHAGRPPSPHTINRICSNDILSGAGAGDYPIDSAAVKEMFTAEGKLGAFAAYRKIKTGATGDAFYWYEKTSESIFADGPNDGSCTYCHELAGRDGNSGHDYVFTQIQR